MFLNNSHLEKHNNNKTFSLISSYYSNQIPSYSNIIKNSVTSLQLTELPKELISDKENEDDLCTKIENSLKKKYNFVIPAIQIEFAADSKIELIKEDLNKFFSLFGEISYINIVEDKSNAYILYKFYFSAMFAYYAIRDILNINNDGQNIINSGNDEKIDVKLFMNKNGNEKEEDEKNINDYENNNNNNVNNFGNNYNMVTPVKSSLDFQFKGSNNFKEKINVLNNFNNNNNNQNNKSNNDNVNNNKINYYQIINNNNNNSINSFNINQKINPFSNKSNITYPQQENNEEDYYENNNNNFINNNKYNNDTLFKNNNKIKFNNNNNINNISNFNNNYNSFDIDPDYYFAQQRQILMNYMMMNYIQNYRYKMINIMKNKDVYLNSKNNPYKEPKINFESFTLDHKNTINFNTFSNREYIFKYVTNYNIQIENDDKFQVTKRIIGKNGFFLKKIIYESCIKYGDNSTKIRLRGKGSGYKEGKVFSESNEPLQLCVSSLNFPTYINCCNLIENLLKRIYKDYAEYLRKITSPELRGNIMEKSISKYIYVVDRFGPKKENYDEEGEYIDKSEDYNNNNNNENCYVDGNNNKINNLNNNNNNIDSSNNIKKCCCNCCCNNKINNINNICNNNECNGKIEEKKEK